MQLQVATGAKETLDQMMTVQLVLEQREMQDKQFDWSKKEMLNKWY
jgi:hypothetical protein